MNCDVFSVGTVTNGQGNFELLKRFLHIVLYLGVNSESKVLDTNSFAFNDA